MKTVKDQTFNGVTVVMDGVHFVGCKITNCELIYSGGTGGWTESDITNCRITLRGPAAYTCGFLDKFDLLNDKGRWDVVKLEYPTDGLPDRVQ